MLFNALLLSVFSGAFSNNLSERKNGLTDEIFFLNVYESGFVFSGSLPASGNIYIRLKPASLIKLLVSSMIFSIIVLNALSLHDGRII